MTAFLCLFLCLSAPVETKRPLVKPSLFSSAAVESAIRSWAREQAETQGMAKVEVVRMVVPNVLKRPPRPVVYEVRAKADKPLVGRQVLYVDMMMGAELFRTLVVNVEIASEGRVAVAKRDIRRGEPIESTSVTWVDQRLKAGSSPAIVEGQLQGQRARTMIRAGKVLTRNDVELVPLVSRSEMVSVRLKKGPLTITLRAMAMENGDLGQVVRLKNMDSGQIMRGMVQETGVVDLVL